MFTYVPIANNYREKYLWHNMKIDKICSGVLTETVYNCVLLFTWHIIIYVHDICMFSFGFAS